MGNIGSSPLHKACNDKDIAKVRWAVQQAPSSVNLQESQMGWSPLHVAAFKSADAIVRELLQRGAQANLADKEGRTPLHLACLNGSDACVRALLRGGARPDVRDKVRVVVRGHAPQGH